MLRDWTTNHYYWASFEESVTYKTSSKVYDGFLKANTQPLGIRSYGACVDLLVDWVKTMN